MAQPQQLTIAARHQIAAFQRLRHFIGVADDHGNERRDPGGLHGVQPDIRDPAQARILERKQTAKFGVAGQQLTHLGDHVVARARLAPVAVDRAPVIPLRSGRFQNPVVERNRLCRFPMAHFIAFIGFDQLAGQRASQQVQNPRQSTGATAVHSQHQNCLRFRRSLLTPGCCCLSCICHEAPLS